MKFLKDLPEYPEDCKKIMEFFRVKYESVELLPIHLGKFDLYTPEYRVIIKGTKNYKEIYCNIREDGYTSVSQTTYEEWEDPEIYYNIFDFVNLVHGLGYTHDYKQRFK